MPINPINQPRPGTPQFTGTGPIDQPAAGGGGEEGGEPVEILQDGSVWLFMSSNVPHRSVVRRNRTSFFN